MNTLNSQPNGNLAAIQAPQITLPKGGGNLKGIAEKFQANPVTGSASFSIPLPVSESRGFSPALSLSYNSGGGNSLFGLGWTLNIPSISRKTEKGLPKYLDKKASDIFLLSEAEDLVPLLIQNGDDWEKEITPKSEGDEPYEVTYYRPRIEGAFARIEQWRHELNGNIHWRSISASGIYSVYGKTENSRIADPENPDKIFKWFLERTYDDKGNSVIYEYKAEDFEGIPNQKASEQHRLKGLTLPVNRYLKRVKYGCTTPFDPLSGTEPDCLFETIFDYGEHHTSVPSPLEENSWAFREDPFSSYRSTFEIRTYRLCQRVLHFHHFSEIGNTPYLVKSLDLSYTQADSGISLLAEATQKGYIRQEDGSYTSQAFPPFSFSYQVHEWKNDWQQVESQSLQGSPIGIDDQHYQWIDLYSEGISGILSEKNNAWYYKHNLGEGTFTPPKLISPKPSLGGISNGRQSIQDIKGDGRKALVSYQSTNPGYYYLGDQEEWQNFQTFENIPQTVINSPQAKFIDLTGDGIADLLVDEDRIFTMYEGKATDGFKASNSVLKSLNEDNGPRLVFSDPSQQIFLADMSGDGLTDLVRIRQADICYWPNMGYGTFGAKICMDDAPSFGHPDSFDPRLIKLVDIDGSGPSDLIYLGKNQFRIWLNHSGNGWSEEPIEVNPFPYLDRSSKISVVDFLGDGTACIVWSSLLPQHRQFPVQYISLLGGQKPLIMSGYNNHMGKEVLFEYTSSTHFYLEDKKAGTPWITRLPFPVQCLTKLTTIDHIGHAQLSTSYSYHHGYYDHEEREFRGFGRVDQWDIEIFETHAEEEETLDIPPILTKSWFHTGAYLKEEIISQQYLHEYYAQDTSCHDFPDSVIDETFTLNHLEKQEAYRALKGSLLRQEVYTLDGSEYEEHPYVVTDSNYTIVPLQPKGENRYASFLAQTRETINYHYERTYDIITATADPRISHSVVLETDQYGHVRKSIQIVYARRGSGSNVFQEQQTLHIIASLTDVHHETDSFYKLGTPHQDRAIEIRGLSPSGNYFSFEELQTQLESALSDDAILDFHQTFGSGIEARLVAWNRHRYWNDTRTEVLSPEMIESLTLLYRAEQAVLPIDYVSDAWDTKIDEIMMLEAGYFQDVGYWWNPGLSAHYLDAASFFQLEKTKDPFEQSTFLEYDSYFLFPISSTDPLENQVFINIDYRTLSPCRLTDINRNISEAITDELGMVIATTAYGTEAGITKGDSPVDIYTRIEDANLEAIIANSADYLQEATSFFFYDLHAWEEHGQALHFVSLLRETHMSELAEGGESNIQIHLGYSDGWGRAMQEKVKVEGGLAWVYNDDSDEFEELETEERWLVSGRTVYNNKEKPIKQYEPFYSATHKYESEEFLDTFGVTPVIHYDPLGRVIRTDTPKGFFSKIEFTPWEVHTYDENDTVKDAAYFAEIDGDGSEEAEALTKAAAHYDTPTTTYLDSLGRAFLSCQYKESGGDALCTYTTFDIQGNPLTQTDPRQYAANQSRTTAIHNLTYRYDMLGQGIYAQGVDVGERWILTNAGGNICYSWNGRGFHQSIVYDELQRPLQIEVDGNGFNHMVQLMKYGEAETNPEDKNLRGQLVRQYDQSGLVETLAFDFKGQALVSVRQLCADYKTVIDWEDISAVNMEGEEFVVSSQFDALGRQTQITQADGSLHKPIFHPSGWLKSVEVQLQDETTFQRFVEDIVYNAKGQRTQIRYGNGITTNYTYEDTTSRLKNLLTMRSEVNGSQTRLQDISYLYDPIGNIVRITDASHDHVFTHNQLVDAACEYTYDALYQLTEASGREHLGLGKNDYQAHSDYFKSTFFATINNTQAVANYTRRYTYDDAGNLTQLRHIASDSSRHFTRNMTVANSSNRAITDEMDTSVDVDSYFDANGNLIALDHLRNLEWNYLDQLNKVDIIERDSENDSEYYVYDASGQRIRKVWETYDSSANLLRKEEKIYLGGVEIKRTYQGNAETLQNERYTLHIMDDQKRITLVHYWTLSSDASISTEQHYIRYQIGNHLGSASMELDDAGQLISYEEYFPYGGTAFTTGSNQSEVNLKEYRYSGKERDDSTGLYYYGARYYAPWMGRWLNTDPAGTVDGLNVYRFVMGNPMKFIDADGEAALPSSLFDTEGKWMFATPGEIRKHFLENDWEDIGPAVDSNNNPRPSEGRILRAPDGSSYARVMHRGGISPGSENPRVVLTENDPSIRKGPDGKGVQQRFIDQDGRPLRSGARDLSPAHLDINSDTINSGVLHKYRQEQAAKKRNKRKGRRGSRSRRGMASVGGTVFMAVALTDGAVAFYSADTWTERFQVGASLAFAEASGYGMAKRYGVKSGFGIGIIFSIISAAGVYKQQERAISEFLHSAFPDKDWGALSRQELHQIREEAKELLFNTPPISSDEFNQKNPEEWGGVDPDQDSITQEEQDLDIVLEQGF